MHKIASFFSYLLHPLFMPGIATFILLKYDRMLTFHIPENIHKYIIGIVVFYTTILPALSAFVLKKFNFISSMEIGNRNERYIPYIFTIVSYFFCYWMLQKYSGLYIISTIILGACIAISISLVINLFFKISAHMIAIGGVCGLLIALQLIFMSDLIVIVIPFILFSGIVGTSRLILGAHKPAEVYSGFILGFFTMFGAVFFSY